jgi:hypothetical protein
VDPKPTEPKAPEIEMGPVTPEMRVGGSERLAASSPLPRARRRRVQPAMLVGTVAALVGVASLATSVWIYSEMRREMLRISTDMAQVRLSLDLYAQRTVGAAPASPAAAPDSTALEALENRLAILEQNWRGSPPGGAAQPAALPSINGPVASTESDGDCLPAGMRLLVAAGDSYPVCGTETTIEVVNVDNGYISLADGTTVPSGSNVPLNGTACTIAVTSGGDEATTGFAEIRVSC